MSVGLSATQRTALRWLAKRPNAEASWGDLRKCVRAIGLSIRGSRLVIDRMLAMGVISPHREPERPELCLTLKGIRAMGWSFDDVLAMQAEGARHGAPA